MYPACRAQPPQLCVCWQRGFFEFDDQQQPTRVGYCVLCPYPPREELGARKKAWGACFFHREPTMQALVRTASRTPAFRPEFLRRTWNLMFMGGGPAAGAVVALVSECCPLWTEGLGQGVWPPLSPCFFFLLVWVGWGFSALATPPHGHDHPLRASSIVFIPSLSYDYARVALSFFGVDCCVPGWASTGRVAQVSPPNIAGGRALTFFMCGGWGLLGGELLASMEAAGC